MNNIPDPPSEENIEPELNHPQQIIPMEVHHHVSAHERKKPMHYFWEFLMLFLAVFCGFLAEYKLEHVIEHQREGTFMKALTEDLNMDVKTLATYSQWRSEVNHDFDSLLLYLSAPDPGAHVLGIHQLASRSIMRFGLPDIHEGTIQQLKNAGGLRLVRKKEVVNAINKHYLMVARMRSVYETERLLRVRLVESSADVLDANLARRTDQNLNSNSLITKDPVMINRFMNMIIAAQSLNKNLIIGLDSTRTSSLKLKELIGKEYKISQH